MSTSAQSTSAQSASAQSTSNSSNTASDVARQTANRVTSSAAEMTQGAAQHYVAEPAQDIFSLLKDYARDKPDVAACWAFGLGVIVGWKLKP